MLIWIAVALAGPQSLQACCAALGSQQSCPTTIEALGPGSQAVPGPKPTVRGLWTVTCSATPSFTEESRTLSQPRNEVFVGDQVREGRVLTALNAPATGCFNAACGLPAGLCLRHEGTYARLADCTTGSKAPQQTWTAAPTSGEMAVVLQGRVLRARPPAAQVQAVTMPSRSTGRGGLPASGAARANLEVPPSPPDPCRPNVAMREPSNEQVELGNEAVMASDLALALDKYRAAITIHECNAFAWAALGDTLLQLDQAARAEPALRAATRLMPTHYGAWMNLGLALEKLGRRDKAADAYERALATRPDHPGAREGLSRTRP